MGVCAQACQNLMPKHDGSDASRVAGVARPTLPCAIRAGRLSVDPDGHIDTAEL